MTTEEYKEMVYGGWLTQGEKNAPAPAEPDLVFTGEQELVIQEIARLIANRAITERTMPAFPVYFVNGNWILTYDYYDTAHRSLQSQIDYLRGELDKPWWKRWWK